MRASTFRGFAVFNFLFSAAVRMRGLAFGITISALVPCGSMRAHIIAEYLGGTGVNGATDFTGQSFTISATDNYTNIVFNFFSQSGLPVATGSGFLFNMPYTGPASGPNIGSPGYLGHTNDQAGNFYTFDPGITLLGGTKYYFYTGLVGTGTIATGGFYGGGEGYVASPLASNPFTGGVGSRNFRVTGTPVPDSGITSLMLGLSLVVLAFHRRRIGSSATE